MTIAMNFFVWDAGWFTSGVPEVLTRPGHVTSVPPVVESAPVDVPHTPFASFTAAKVISYRYIASKSQYMDAVAHQIDSVQDLLYRYTSNYHPASVV